MRVNGQSTYDVAALGADEIQQVGPRALRVRELTSRDLALHVLRLPAITVCVRV